MEELTRVRREVFPEPLGPINSIEGRVVRPDARKTTEWRKTGIEMARRIAITRPRGDGLKRACAQSPIPAIIISTIEVFRKRKDLLILLLVQRLKNKCKASAEYLEKDRPKLTPCNFSFDEENSASSATPRKPICLPLHQQLDTIIPANTFLEMSSSAQHQ